MWYISIATPVIPWLLKRARSATFGAAGCEACGRWRNRVCLALCNILETLRRRFRGKARRLRSKIWRRAVYAWHIIILCRCQPYYGLAIRRSWVGVRKIDHPFRSKMSSKRTYLPPKNIMCTLRPYVSKLSMGLTGVAVNFILRIFYPSGYFFFKVPTQVNK